MMDVHAVSVGVSVGQGRGRAGGGGARGCRVKGKQMLKCSSDQDWAAHRA